MVKLASLCYTVLGVSDLAAWEDYASNVVGFQIGKKSADALALRMDERPFRIQLESGPEDDLRAAGWQLACEADHRALKAQLEAAGVVVTVDPELAQRRQVEHLFHCQDPVGYRHEFVCSPMSTPDSEPFKSPLMQGRFVTGRLGMGHFVVVCKDLERAMQFHEAMGLTLSGYIQPMGTALKLAFYHARNGRYHSLATGVFPGGKRLRHIGLELADFNDVGRAMDRAMAAGLVERQLGQHPNAKTVSFYLNAPGGLGFELFFGEIVCDDSNWVVESYQQTSSWGHKPVK